VVQHTFAASARRYFALFLSAVLLAGLLATMGSSPAHAATTETEPNGSTSTADVVRLGTTINGSTSGSSNRDTDIYAVDFPADGKIDLGLTFPSGLGTDYAYGVEVINSAGQGLYNFDITGDQNSGSWLASQAMYTPKGRLYVSISGSSGRASWGKSYSLTVKSTPGVVETEFNDDTASADALPLGTTISGSTLRSSNRDTDIYAIDFPSNGKLSLIYKFQSGLGSGYAYNIDVLNSAGESLYNFDLTGAEYNGSWLKSQTISVSRGRGYISVSGGSGRAAWGKTYTLLTTLSFKTAQIPTISGTASVGKSLSAQLGTWSPQPTAVTYQWKRNGSDIPGATQSTYTLVTADAGSKITVTASGSRTGYTTATKTSAPKAIALLSLTATPVPKISGTAKVGKVLTAQSGTWGPSPVSVSYQWQRNGKTIAGATKSTYTVKKADAGQKITVKVTGKKTNYTTTSKTSAAKSIPAR
jgi:hypothetical protein